MPHEPITLPTGVTLRDPEDFTTLRRTIFDTAKKNITSAFPASFNGVRAELHDVDYTDPEEYDLDEQKKALLENKFLGRRLRGTVKLFDEASDKQLDERTMTLMRVPFLTHRGTFINNGSEYSHAHQARMLHGGYTRQQANGDYETQFNVKSGTGSAFRVGFEPPTAQYRLRVGDSHLHLYSLLKDLGVPDKELSAAWGDQVLAKNQEHYDARVFEKAYQHLVPKRLQVPDADTAQKSAAIRQALDSARVHRAAVSRTLPGMLSEKSAKAFRDRLQAVIAETDAIAFAPDIAPDICAAMSYEQACPEQFFKTASMCGVPVFEKMANVKQHEDFSPDLGEDEMQSAYNAIYAKVGPQLAGMRSWPERWYTQDSDPLGWVSWYLKYSNGTRGDDDERQIRRWKMFKARQGASFKRKPTARKAFSLQYWAIDPFKLLETDAQKQKLKSEMADYRRSRMEEYAEKNASMQQDLSSELADTEHQVELPETTLKLAFLQNQPWVGGLIKSANDGHTFRGCLMAGFADSDAQSIIRWSEKNIPDTKLAGDGYEREVHATVLFGMRDDVSAEDLESVITEVLGSPKFPAFISVGEIKRFPAHTDRPESDVLVLRCDSPMLNDMHHALREKLGDKVRVTFPDYNCHITLAYVKPGALRKLDGHDYFHGMLIPVREYIYSVSSREKKLKLKIHDEKV